MIEFLQQVVFIGVVSVLLYLFVVNPYQVIYRRWKEDKPLKWQPEDVYEDEYRSDTQRQSRMRYYEDPDSE